MELVIEVYGAERPGTDIESLLDQLHRRDDLDEAEIASRVHVPTDGAMGPFTDALLVAFGSGGVVVGLAEALSTWLRSRKSNVTVCVTKPDGTKIEISVDAAHDPAAVAALARDLADM